MSAPDLRIVIACSDDLTAACKHGRAFAAEHGVDVLVQWGAVCWAITPAMSLDEAHRAFFAAAKQTRQRRDAERGPPRNVAMAGAP